MNLESWLEKRDEAEGILSRGTTATPDLWKMIQREAEQEIERILRA